MEHGIAQKDGNNECMYYENGSYSASVVTNHDKFYLN